MTLPNYKLSARKSPEMHGRSLKACFHMEAREVILLT